MMVMELVSLVFTYQYRNLNPTILKKKDFFKDQEIILKTNSRKQNEMKVGKGIYGFYGGGMK